MSLISMKGIIRNGRVELEEPIDLPDGTAVVVTSGNPTPEDDDDWDNTPEGIADWLAWYKSLKPLIFTPEEVSDTEAWLKKINDYSIANIDKGIEDLFR